jgi:acyl-coenzyme A thioesterase PaaI-like protein
MKQSIGPGLRLLWRRISSLPGGRWLFSRALGWYVPYTGSLGARVEILEPGHCVITLRDRRRVRNHLQSVHAIALCNLGEMVTGLALMNSLPDNARGILAGLSIVYLKKARGLLTAECHCDSPESNEALEYELTGEIRDNSGDQVALVKARWLIGPEREPANGNTN